MTESYRDYLRSVFVLFAHQQKLGVGADPKTFPDVVERQLKRRFFQDFRTADRTEVPLNRLLVPLVTAILTAPDRVRVRVQVAAATLPAQGTRTDRQHLDALLALAPVNVQEFANRYRLPLTEPDSATSTPVKLNIYTLSRILSDTAQGPVEPRRERHRAAAARCRGQADPVDGSGGLGAVLPALRRVARTTAALLRGEPVRTSHPGGRRVGRSVAH